MTRLKGSYVASSTKCPTQIENKQKIQIKQDFDKVKLETESIRTLERERVVLISNINSNARILELKENKISNMKRSFYATSTRYADSPLDLVHVHHMMNWGNEPGYSFYNLQYLDEEQCLGFYKTNWGQKSIHRDYKIITKKEAMKKLKEYCATYPKSPLKLYSEQQKEFDKLSKFLVDGEPK